MTADALPTVITRQSITAAFTFSDLATVRDRVALRLRLGRAADHRDVTFSELHAGATGFAAALAEHGALPGDRIALLLPHSDRLIMSFFGAVLGGFVPSIVAWPTVKMDKEKYQRNLRAVVGNLEARWLVTEGDVRAGLGDALGETRVVAAAFANTAAPAPTPPPPPSTATAFIQFSGGTTGTQKSVAISWEHLATQLDRYARVLGLDDADRFTSWLPLYHDMGLIACLVLPFIARLPVSTFSPIEWVMDPRGFLRSFATDRPTLCWLPNFAFSFLAKRAPKEALDLSSLRRIINCSEPVRSDSMDAFLTRFARDGLRSDALHTCYAMAEATFAVTQSTDASPPRRLDVSIEALRTGELASSPGPTRTLVSCGPKLDAVEIRIVDDAQAPVAERVVGEIWLKGAFMMDGYLAPRAGATSRDAFTDGWYRTGDLGALVDDHLYVTGRKKDLIIIGGVNVYPEDIESTVGELDGVHAGRVVALGLVNEVLGTEQLVVVAEAETDAAAGSADARAGTELLIRAAVLTITGIAPTHVFVVPPKWIVKSTAGKIARAETRARLLSRWDDLTNRSTETPGEN